MFPGQLLGAVPFMSVPAGAAMPSQNFSPPPTSTQYTATTT